MFQTVDFETIWIGVNIKMDKFRHKSYSKNQTEQIPCKLSMEMLEHFFFVQFSLTSSTWMGTEWNSFVLFMYT